MCSPMLPKIRALYDGSRHPVELSCPPEKGRTIPDVDSSTNINSIVSRYTQTGFWPGNLASASRYSSTEEALTYHELHNIKAALKSCLSPTDRALFDIDPSGYLSQLSQRYTAASSPPPATAVPGGAVSPDSASAVGGSPPQGPTA